MRGSCFGLLVLRLAAVSARQDKFSVNNDVLAYPQFDTIHSETYLTEAEAQEILDAQYRHRFLKDPVSGDTLAANYGQSEADEALLADQQYEEMVLRGRRHLCAIPQVADESLTGEQDTPQSLAEREQELIRASDHGWELLESMKGNCLYYQAGWWVYSFCFDDGVSQFHPMAPGGQNIPYPPMPDPNVPHFTLGRYDKPLQIDAHAAGVGEEVKPLNDEQRTAGKAVSTQLQRPGEANYLVQKLGGGTECDLTGHEREITIQFHCNPGVGDRIAVIKETASCVYLMIIHTPRLCGDVAFQPPQVDRPHPITCSEIVGDDELSTWKLNKAAEVAHDLMTERAPAGKKQLVIGGIEVGGQKLVGMSPDKRIKSSNIVKPRDQQRNSQEKHVATLAKSDGKYVSVMSEKEIKKLGLKHNSDEVAGWVEKIESMADPDEPWRIEIVQGPDGMQIRAILGSDSDDDDEESESLSGESSGLVREGIRDNRDAGRSSSNNHGVGKKGSGNKKPQQQDDDESEESGSKEEYKDKSEL